MLLDFIKENNNYCYMHNGLIKESNINLESLSFKNDQKIILIHDIDSDTNINYDLFTNVSVTILELLHINNSCTINRNIYVNDNSSLNIVSIESSKENLKININNFTKLNTNSTIDNMKITIFSSDAKEIDNSELNSNNGKLLNYNVYINSSKENLDINSKVSHLYKDSESIMTNYGICKGGSKMTINTNGFIARGAKRTNVRQKSKGILLDLESSIEANPWLQIDEYDCLASHGAGIGAIDEEELYYLMSRGLTRLTSEQLIIGGFLNPVFEKILELGFGQKIVDYYREEINKFL